MRDKVRIHATAEVAESAQIGNTRYLSTTLIERVRELGAEVVIHNPYVAYKSDIYEMAQGCDTVAVIVTHGANRGVEWEKMQRRILVGGRYTVSALTRWNYRGLGKTRAI